jgi:hypothetical protein
MEHPKCIWTQSSLAEAYVAKEAHFDKALLVLEVAYPKVLQTLPPDY